MIEHFFFKPVKTLDNRVLTTKQLHMKYTWLFTFLIALLCFIACEKDSLTNSVKAEDSSSVSNTQLEGRTNDYLLLPSEMGDLHNSMLDEYYTLFSNDVLPNSLYSNQDLEVLISRFYDLNQNNLPEIFDEFDENELTVELVSLFPEQPSGLDEFKVYTNLVDHQNSVLISANEVSSDLIDFLYENSIEETDLESLTARVQSFDKNHDLSEHEQFLLYTYLEIYLASDAFWTDYDNNNGGVLAANGWWVRGADAWGGIVMGGLGLGAGPLGGVVGGAIGSQVFSAAMEHT